ncbi:MAG: spore coat protein CotH, partial [Candidatus Marinimicrobia bacterium]|nr:spore coat protein CotH [Candidatus Neomarinimicrobiota bacterium]
MSGSGNYFLQICTSWLLMNIYMLYGDEVDFTYSNLPIIIINTNGESIPDEPKIPAYMSIIHNEDINYITDVPNHYDGSIGIEVRGHSSQSFPKKQYLLETRDSNGNVLNCSLFGMPDENDWVLYAPYSDKSLMRNVIAYNIARSLGFYAPRTQFCEVLLNDEYIGVYV